MAGFTSVSRVSTSVRAVKTSEMKQVQAPAISVVMPVLNAAGFLRASIDSVLAQSFGDIEVICIDDGSSDDSVAILQAFAARDRRLRVLQLPENKGPSVARNTGINAATGEFVFFLDADDSLPDDALRQLVQAARDTGCALVLGRVDWRRDAAQAPALSGSGGVQVEDAAVSAHLQSIPGCHCCNLYARSLLDSEGIRYPEDLSFGEDQLFQARAILAADRVALLDAVVYIYHHYRGQSLTRRTPVLQNLLDDVEFQCRIARLFRTYGLQAAALRYVSAWSYSIREQWLRFSWQDDANAAGPLFNAVRAMSTEFTATPWTENTPATHRELLLHILGGRDQLALQWLLAHRPGA